jgi:hypothetical protein
VPGAPELALPADELTHVPAEKYDAVRALAMLVIAFAAMAWWGTVGDLDAWRRHSAIDKRGLTTTATVLNYSYDPDGGDPDGWTIDRVRFVTAGGTTVVTTIGHHSAGPEITSRRMAVSYDPQHPAVARAAHYDDQADDPWNAVIGAVMSLLISAAGIFLGTRVLTTARKGSPTVVDSASGSVVGPPQAADGRPPAPPGDRS